MLEGTPPHGHRDPNATDIDRTAEESGSQIKETIEDATRRVREKVSEATQEVREKAGNATQQVREQVTEAAEQVRGFDVQQQVRSHPWMALGVAAVAGYVFGSMGGSSHSDNASRSSDAERYRDTERSNADWRSRMEQGASKADMHNTQSYYWSPSAAHTAGYGQQERYTEPTPRYAQATGFAQPSSGSQSFDREQHAERTPLWDNVRDQFGDELRTLMTAAIGAAISLVRDTVSESLPQFAEEYDRRRREQDDHDQTATSSHQAGTSVGQSATDRNRPMAPNDDRTRTAQHTPTFGSESDVEQRSGFTKESL
jgi:ElaB/YqjD/DUF883 family membrane-anchored ribosome-binding protein